MPDLEKLGELYQVSRRVTAAIGGNLFFSHGTLLGLERDGGWITDDDDLDTAFVSWKGPAGACEQLTAIGVKLNEIGYDAHVSTPMKTHLHVHHPEDYDARIDLFYYFFDRGSRGVLVVPSGVASETGSLIASEWGGYAYDSFEGIPGLKPVQRRQLLAHIYGDDWETPLTGSDWHWGNRIKREDPEHRLTRRQVRRVENTRRAQWRERRDCEKRQA